MSLLHAIAPTAVSIGDSVQLFPPGRNIVTPTPADGSEPQEMELTIDEATATELESQRAEMQAKADAGEGDRPYLDFNHEDGEAAAWVREIYWAGDDPQQGGVRARVEWSAAGRAAVEGRTYRRFSPSFHTAGGRVTALPTNMGGLVNRAAFTRIQPFFAKAPETQEESPVAATEPQQQSATDPKMSPEEIAALQEENAKLKASLEEMQKRLDEMSAAQAAAAEVEAKATVAAAAKDGRIPPGEELQAKWVKAIIADPEAKELLAAMAPNPALTATIVHAKAAPDAPADATPKPTGLDAVAASIAATRASKER